MKVDNYFFTNATHFEELVEDYANEQQSQLLPCQQALDMSEDRYLAENYGEQQKNWSPNQLLVLDSMSANRFK